MDPPAYPDDGPVSKNVRKIDHYLGAGEQGLLFGLLAIVVLVAAAAALSDKLGGHQLGRWWHYIVRGGTFTIFVAFMLFRSGMKQREVVGGTEDLDVFGIFKVNDADIVTTMPIAAAM